MNLARLATLYRAAQFRAHAAHQLAYGPSFFADHAFLGGLYDTYETAYDGLVERMIGQGQTVSPGALTLAAAQVAKSEPAEAFKALLQLERELCDEIARALPGATDGVQNLLQGLADESEARQYQLGQRIS